MSSNTLATVSLVGAGGNPPYTFTVVGDSETTISASISGSSLTVNAGGYAPGLYTVHLRIADAAGNTYDDVIPVNVVNPQVFSILTANTLCSTQSFPQTYSISLQSSGGNGTVVWSLITDATTLSGVTIGQNNTLSFTVTEYGEWSVGIQAIDATQRAVVKVITVTVASPTAFNLTNGQFELDVTVPVSLVGNHNFTIGVQDSNAANASKSYTYQVMKEVSTVDITEASVDYFWGGTGDNTTVVFPIAGSLAGLSVGIYPPTVASNGLTVSVNSADGIIEVSGPPTSFSNSEVYLQIPLQSAGNQVALISRLYTLEAHSSATDIGNFTCYTQPYTVGSLIGLNPERPYFNAPNIMMNTSYSVRVQSGSSLPLGLSLDAVTGLIYGTVLAPLTNSIIEYIDASLNVHGTITIVWDISVSSFTLIDSLTSGQIQTPYTASLSSNSQFPLTSATVHRGRLPLGLTLSVVNGTTVQIQGTPTESGYFDIWLAVTNSGSQTAFFYKRFVVSYAPPLLILTTSLPSLVTGAPYLATLTGFGGEPPYAWAITGGSLPSGLTLNASSGIISGTTAATAYNQNLTIQLTDSAGVSVSSIINLQINNTLRIATSVIPKIIPGQMYSFQMVGLGGVTPYTWVLTTGSPALPTGITFSSSGLLSGATSAESYQQTIGITLTDSAGTNVTGTFNLQITQGTGIVIDSSGIVPIARGANYQGTLAASGYIVLPVTWAVSPNSPNPLATGLSLNASTADQGTTAFIAGSTTAKFSHESVLIQAVDAVGTEGTAFVFMSTYSSLAITTASLPNATAGGRYSTTLSATGYNPAFTWTASGLPAGYSITSGGVLSGVGLAAGTFQVVFTVTDSINDSTSVTIPLVVQLTTLNITTTSLPTVTAGVPITFALGATGGVAPYVWSISPSSAAQLPSGLTLSNAGVISGTNFQGGYSQNLTFRVTDNISNYMEATFTLTVTAALKIQSGIDYIDILNTNSLGYVSTGNVGTISPNPDRTFYVVATNVISTSQSQISALISGASGVSISLVSFSARIAVFSLAGSFSSGSVGTNHLTVTVNDSGVVVSKSLTWTVYAPSSLSAAFTVSGSIPLLEGISGQVPIYNNGSSFTMPTYNGASVNLGVLANNAFSLGTQDNYSYLDRVSIQGSTGISLAYNGTPFNSGVTGSSLVISQADVAWYNSNNQGMDLYAVTSQGGGQTLDIGLSYLTSPQIGSIQPTTVSGDGGTHTFTISLTKPLNPSQSGAVCSVSFGGYITVTGVTAITTSGTYRNPHTGGGFLTGVFITGYTVTATVAATGSAVTSSITPTITSGSPLTFLSGGALQTQVVTYVSGTSYPLTITPGVYESMYDYAFDDTVSAAPPPTTFANVWGYSYFLQTNLGAPGINYPLGIPGTVVTVYYADTSAGGSEDSILANAFNSGLPTYVYVMFSGTPATQGPYVVQVTSIGLGEPINQPRNFYYFTYSVPNSAATFYPGSGHPGYTVSYTVIPPGSDVISLSCTVYSPTNNFNATQFQYQLNGSSGVNSLGTGSPANIRGYLGGYLADFAISNVSISSLPNGTYSLGYYASNGSGQNITYWASTYTRTDSLIAGSSSACPDIEMYLNEGLKVSEVENGALLDCLDKDTHSQREQHAVLHHEYSLQPTVYLRTANGAEIIVSHSTPVPTVEAITLFAEGRDPSEEGIPFHSEGMYVGLHLLTDVGNGLENSELVEVKDMGNRLVSKINVGGRNFASGKDSTRRIFTHNASYVVMANPITIPINIVK
jgi:Putative Ig domain